MSKNVSVSVAVAVAEPKPEPTEEVTLAADHEHQGEQHKKGAQITVPKRVADWLRSNGVVDPAPASAEG